MAITVTHPTASGQALVPTWTVGDRLRKAREAAGLGVEEIASKLGRSRNSVTRYERSATVDTLIVRAYAEFTEVSMRWLLTGVAPEGGEPVMQPVTLRERRDTWRGNRPNQLRLKLVA